MATLGTKLVGMDAIPATIHYADGGQDGPLEIQHVQLDGDTVTAVIYVRAGDTRSLARITGDVSDEELALQIPTAQAEFDSLDELAADDETFETVKTVTGIETDL